LYSLILFAGWRICIDVNNVDVSYQALDCQ
jgi:hypothetical protein